MKLTQLKIIATTSFVALLSIQETTAQNGMDRSGTGTGQYSRLHRAIIPLLENNQNEKALGVYTANQLPSSTLEINTTNAYLPFLHPNLAGDRGLVFRSVAPAGFTQQWQMFRDNNQIFRLFNTQGTVNATLETTQPGSSLIINTNGTNERARFNQDGNLELRTPTTEPYPTLVNYDADAKADVFGAIRTSHISGSSVSGTAGAEGTILYGATNMIGAPSNDGYRMRWDNHFFTNFNDALIFEKTDGQQSTPNGGHAGIVFANTGQNDTVVTAMVIKGNGRVGIGKVFGPSNKTSANSGTTIGAGSFRPWAHLDISETDAIAPQLRLTQTPHANSQMGVYTDFQTTGIINSLGEGNLLINPRYTDTLGFVAINLRDATTPLNKRLALDVNGQQNLRYVEKDTTNLQYVLVWDSLNNGRIKYRSISDLINSSGGTGGGDQDWFVQGTTTIPSNINQNIYTNGNVAINSLFSNNNSLFVNNTTNSTAISAKTTTPTLTTIAGIGFSSNVVTNSSNGNIGYAGNVSGGSGNNFGVNIDAWNSTGQNIGIKARGFSSNIINPTNYGGLFSSFNASTRNVGVEGAASTVSALTSGNENIGGRFVALGNFNNTNYGIWAKASGSGGSTNRAGYFVGIAESTSGGVLTSDKMFKTNVENIKGATDVLRKLKPHTYKMDVNGFPQFNFQDRLQYGFIAQEVGDVLPDLVHDSYMPSELDSLGNEISPAVSYKSLNYNALIPITVQAVNEITERIDKSTLSDQNVKTNVQNLSNSLDKVKQMRGVSYEWTSSAQNNMNLDSLQHIGFIAQEIAAIEPLLTFVDDSSLVHVNYDRVVPLLVESVKELDGKVQSKDSIIENLETRLAYLENCIRNANICNEGNKTSNQELNNEINQRSIEITNHSSIILDQNLPNPFAENTVINYNIPTDVMEAKLMFYDLNGRIIKELIIEERGESKLTVYGENLKTGVYTYSLIADGELIATKKMVKK